MKLKNLCLLAVVIFLNACKSKVHLSPHSLKSFESDLPLEYLLSNKTETDKKVFFMVEDPDTNDPLQRMLFEELHKNDWQIIVPLPQGGDYQTKQILDSRENRLSAAFQIYYHLLGNKTLDSTHTLLICGIKEQGYLVPQLYNAFNADKLITINTGPHNYLYEIEKLQYYEDSSFKNTEEFKALYIPNLKSISGIIKKIEKDPSLNFTLGKNTNRDWLSYYHYQTSGDFLAGEIRGVVLISEEYPFIHHDSKTYFDALLKVNPDEEIDIIKMPGTGDYTKEKEREILLEYFKNALNEDH